MKPVKPVTADRLRSLPYPLAAAFAFAWLIDISPYLPSESDGFLPFSGTIDYLIVAAAFGVLALAHKRIDALFERPASLSVASTLCFLLMVASTAPSITQGLPAPALAAISASIMAIIALYQAFVFVFCLKKFARLNMIDTMLTLIAWQFFIALLRPIEAATSTALISIAAPVAIAACFLIPAAAPHAAKDGSNVASAGPTASPESGQAKAPRFPFRLLALNALVVFTIYALHEFSTEPFVNGSFVGAFAAVFIMLGMLAASGKIVRMRQLYNVSLVLLEASIVVFAVGTAASYLSSAMLLDASYVVFSTFFFTVLCNACQRGALPSTLVFASAYAVEHLAAFAGELVASLTGTGAQTLPLVVLAVLGAVAFTCFSTDEDYRTMWGTARSKRRYLDPASYFYSLAETCASIAMQYSLSQRESDVLLLLAQKKTAAQISADLVVSIATVKTHTHNIYKKLDVHSKKELLDFIGHPSVNDDVED